MRNNLSQNIPVWFLDFVIGHLLIQTIAVPLPPPYLLPVLPDFIEKIPKCIFSPRDDKPSKTFTFSGVPGEKETEIGIKGSCLNVYPFHLKLPAHCK